MRVLIAGSTGLIGEALVARLRDEGDEVRRLVRREARNADEHSWDPPAGRISDGAFEGVDVVVNLCGAPLASGRWSAARKQVLYDSRLEPTEVLAEAVAQHGVPVLVNASGINFYGDTGNTTVDESAPAGEGFLAGLCTAWERATAPAAEAGARVLLLRTAPVMTGRGGLLRILKPLFWLGLGGKLGDGGQYMPWISITDHISAIRFALDNKAIAGPVNLTAPNPVTNAEFTRIFGRVVHRPAPWWVPSIALKAVLGEGAEDMVLTGPRALPGVLEKAGFGFIHTDLEAALAEVL